ncbi:Ubiquitin carboxyl-terminal hydrolase [Wickerhamomyces ciferrii]|uniref:Ubiquitin carboxyl-terminal hydrolase n=1 Tax=Wickerhamomyces ciferrii (strain ATCC 14091 / BCRC 22168 / CBS 111 / JCM 3599 / NBRC 0793 / NRRL Y-1031 F-60-10) TaxID=1206466 RepID=K0KR23_WICCF|nr:Ubiquitin carboxyl-terminal hydrolase [Wickerhamomyces ciferrii]CCH45581.1 Ubiquitin carboxyl-terminal hydrolase [Wickerhamomyces ciferrii]
MMFGYFFEMVTNNLVFLDPIEIKKETQEDSIEDEDLIAKYSHPTSFKATTGLRGFVNMGSTCFMSSVLQTIIHNPIIRNYFMSEGHIDCLKGKNECITCCVDEIITDFFTSNKTSGFGPTSLLSAAWKSNKSLAGYSEQDAHEFWQFLVNELHHGLTSGDNHNSSTCDCVVHKAFSSDLQSSITCLECGNITNATDPMIDLSLEISGQNDNVVDCLRNFTQTEQLDIKYSCSKCNQRTNATKQLSILKFPNVLSLQLKRFKHNNQSIKIESFIKFPMFINMSEFATISNNVPQAGALNYELFAVVCHIGSVNTGHYITVIKNNEGKWFRFDDSVVTLLEWEQVSKLQAYLLFYMIHQL